MTTRAVYRDSMGVLHGLGYSAAPLSFCGYQRHPDDDVVYLERRASDWCFPEGVYVTCLACLACTVTR